MHASPPPTPVTTLPRRRTYELQFNQLATRLLARCRRWLSDDGQSKRSCGAAWGLGRSQAYPVTSAWSTRSINESVRVSSPPRSGWRRTPAQGQQRCGVNYLSWRATEGFDASMTLLCQATGEEGRVLTMRGRKLATWVVIADASAVERLGQRHGPVGPPTRVRVWFVGNGGLGPRMMGGGRVGRPWGGAHAPL